MLLIYGATGYTGRLIVAEALARGVRPILGGRDATTLKSDAKSLNLEWRAASLDSPSALDAALRGVSAVLHCAGPFIHTWHAMSSACLRNQVHYLDITGEIEVFESLARRDDDAKRADIMLLPGAGFDVVPSDSLAAHLARRLPDASHLSLAFHASGGLSRGTMLTMVENLGAPGAVRRDGKIMRVPAAWRTRRIDFGDGDLLEATTIPWGDVATAYHSTGIANVEVYTTMPATTRRLAKASRWLGPLLRTPVVRRALQARVRQGRPGPNATARSRGYALLWGEAATPDGRRAASRLRTPHAYVHTAHAAVHLAMKALDGKVKRGFQTPSRAYGADVVLELPGVTRTDVPADRAQ